MMMVVHDPLWLAVFLGGGTGRVPLDFRDVFVSCSKVHFSVNGYSSSSGTWAPADRLPGIRMHLPDARPTISKVHSVVRPFGGNRTWQMAHVCWRVCGLLELFVGFSYVFGIFWMCLLVSSIRLTRWLKKRIWMEQGPQLPTKISVHPIQHTLGGKHDFKGHWINHHFGANQTWCKCMGNVMSFWGSS